MAGPNGPYGWFGLPHNQDCAELREIADKLLKQHNVTPPGDKCLQAYSMYVNSSAVSENCLSIEGYSPLILTFHVLS